MSWARFDDRMPFHPRVLAAGDAATGLWVRAIAWSCGAGTDGHVSAEAAVTLGPEERWTRLVDVGLVVRATGGGYEIHNFLRWQPSAAETAQKRAHRAEAGRAGGKAKARRQQDGPRLAVATSVATTTVRPLSCPDPDPDPDPVPSCPVPHAIARASTPCLPQPADVPVAPPLVASALRETLAPDWWSDACATVAQTLGRDVDDVEARWLEYSARCERKGWPMGHRDAVGWLSQVLRAESSRTKQLARARHGPVQGVVEGAWEIPEGMP